MGRQRRPLWAALSGLVTAGGTAASVYALAVRPWHMRWGAAHSEVERALPGDDLVPAPRYRATHAVTIRAAVADVWPWLVQIGQGRAGFYSYDWIENALGLNIHSADRIIPEFQVLRPGDVIPLAPDGFGIPVVEVQPGRALVLGGELAPRESGANSFAASWVFVLEPVAEDATRLIERIQMDYAPTALNRLLFQVLMEPGSFLMERRMLLGIKARAEQQVDASQFGALPLEYEVPLDE
ncbi:MAG: hypothetical protein Kow0077_11830 [Anaerolineae bacterium]